MRLALRRLRAAAILPAALLLTAIAVAPASASHPQTEPPSFHAEALAEDGCTYFMTDGTAAWGHHEPSTVHIEGVKNLAARDSICLHVVPSDRQIVFSALNGDGTLVARDTVPFPYNDPDSYEYSLDLEAEVPIEAVQIAVCTATSGGTTSGAACGETVTVSPDDVTTPYCNWTYQIVADWGTGFQANIGLTPLETAAQDWQIIIQLPPGTTIQVWNAEVVVNGSTVIITPPPWGSPIAPGSTFWLGFIAWGESPAIDDFTVTMDGNLCTVN